MWSGKEGTSDTVIDGTLGEGSVGVSLTALATVLQVHREEVCKFCRKLEYSG